MHFRATAKPFPILATISSIMGRISQV
uniref:Uncharacterized protein n=1 Tax=Anguilla anguilla TaxID=7936 RepID=A0A0E9WD69_ANGAN